MTQEQMHMCPYCENLNAPAECAGGKCKVCGKTHPAAAWKPPIGGAAPAPEAAAQ